MIYKKNQRAPTFSGGRGQEVQVPILKFEEAVSHAHEVINQFASFQVDVFKILGMRNLSAFIGELYAASLIAVTGEQFVKNPHQDGYPDLLLMDAPGLEDYARLQRSGQLREKAPFSPFPNGGIEVKATCGSVPTPERCRRLGLDEKPDIGDQRIGVMVGYDWKAHHRDTNNLVGILWDFVERVPRITAVFFCPSLTVDDWGAIVQPRAGGGRTTSVSIMTRQGVRKMYQNWIIVLDEDPRYGRFLDQYNSGGLIRSASAAANIAADSPDLILQAAQPSK